MTIEQLVAQWNASIENVQQQPSSALTEDSAVQVRSSVSAGATYDIHGNGKLDNGQSCTYTFVATSGCW